MENRRIPVKWVVSGYIDTPYPDLESAVKYALDSDTPLPKGPGVCREFAGSKPWAAVCG